MGIFSFFKKENSVTVPKTNFKSNFSPNFIEDTLNMVIKFIVAYKTTIPDEWLHFWISYETKEDCGIIRYFLKFKITVGNWWNGILYNDSDIVDYMMNVFHFDSSENEFIYYLPVGFGHSYTFPDELKEISKNFLSSYAQKNDSVKLKIDELGASYSNH